MELTTPQSDIGQVRGNLSTTIIHDVPHIVQRSNWDCGVSCVMMLLSQEQRTLFNNNFTQICTEEGFGQSTWTIDLCYLLKRFNIPHCMYTTMAGVNEEYRNQSYYSRIIDIDRSRVKQRFEKAASNGIQVIQREISMDQIMEHLRSHGPVILLVDAGLLACDVCKYNKLKSAFRECFGGKYRGHYIVLVGAAGRRIVYRDPARRGPCVHTSLSGVPAPCAAPARRVARAAAARGTDRDVILVYGHS